MAHLLSLPFAMASSDPMPRYFLTLTPFISKYSPAASTSTDVHYLRNCVGVPSQAPDKLSTAGDRAARKCPVQISYACANALASVVRTHDC